MARATKHPFANSLSVSSPRRLAYMSKNASAVMDNRLFAIVEPVTTSKYLGPSTRSVRYLGARLDAQINLGIKQLFP